MLPGKDSPPCQLHEVVHGLPDQGYRCLHISRDCMPKGFWREFEWFGRRYHDTLFRWSPCQLWKHSQSAYNGTGTEYSTRNSWNRQNRQQDRQQDALLHSITFLAVPRYLYKQRSGTASCTQTEPSIHSIHPSIDILIQRKATSICIG